MPSLNFMRFFFYYEKFLIPKILTRITILLFSVWIINAQNHFIKVISELLEMSSLDFWSVYSSMCPHFNILPTSTTPWQPPSLLKYHILLHSMGLHLGRYVICTRYLFIKTSQQICLICISGSILFSMVLCIFFLRYQQMKDFCYTQIWH